MPYVDRDRFALEILYAIRAIVLPAVSRRLRGTVRTGALEDEKEDLSMILAASDNGMATALMVVGTTLAELERDIRAREAQALTLLEDCQGADGLDVHAARNLIQRVIWTLEPDGQVTAETGECIEALCVLFGGERGTHARVDQ